MYLRTTLFHRHLTLNFYFFYSCSYPLLDVTIKMLRLERNHERDGNSFLKRNRVNNEQQLLMVMRDRIVYIIRCHNDGFVMPSKLHKS